MNQPVKILVVEDEMIIASKISALIEDLGYEVAAIFLRAEKALIHAESEPLDMAILDINLKGQMDGIELAHALRSRCKVPVIFLTANTDDATFERARAAKPYAFVNKPFEESDLQRAIALALERISDEQKPHPIKDAEANTSSGELTVLNDRIFVRHQNRMVKVDLHEIYFAEADRTYCKIYTAHGNYLLSIPLGTFEEKLSSADFLRIHRSYIINLRSVDAINEQHDVITIGKNNLPVSRSHRQELVKRLRVI